MAFEKWIGRDFWGKHILGIEAGNAIWTDGDQQEHLTPFHYLVKECEDARTIPEGTSRSEADVRHFDREEFRDILGCFKQTHFSSIMILAHMGVEITQRSLVEVEKALVSWGAERHDDGWRIGQGFGLKEIMNLDPKPSPRTIMEFITGISSSGGSTPVRLLYQLWDGDVTYPGFCDLVMEAGFRVRDTKHGHVIYGVHIEPKAVEPVKEKPMVAKTVDLTDIVVEIRAQTQKDVEDIDRKYKAILGSLDDWRKAAHKEALNSVRVKLGMVQRTDEAATAVELLRHAIEANLGKA